MVPILRSRGLSHGASPFSTTAAMARFRVSSFIGACCVLAATAADAQTVVNARLTAPFAPGGGAVTAFGYYMSPYSGTVNGVLQRLNCVDFFHDVMIDQ